MNWPWPRPGRPICRWMTGTRAEGVQKVPSPLAGEG
jgi:hypothetical protein